jgi:hypothetical protein
MVSSAAATFADYATLPDALTTFEAKRREIIAQVGAGIRDVG